jgi:hypothetical protein
MSLIVVRSFGRAVAGVTIVVVASTSSPSIVAAARGGRAATALQCSARSPRRPELVFVFEVPGEYTQEDTFANDTNE